MRVTSWNEVNELEGKYLFDETTKDSLSQEKSHFRIASESTILVFEKGSFIYNILGYESTFENDRFLATVRNNFLP